MEEGDLEGGQLENLHIASIVVWHVHLKPSVLIEVGEGKRTNCAALVGDNVVSVLEDGSVTSGVQ